MKIQCSAIKFYLNDYPQIACGKRHADILGMLFKHQIPYDKNNMIQGFLTDDGYFVDRYEAKKIAQKANQIVEETNLLQLFSEDIWPE